MELLAKHTPWEVGGWVFLLFSAFYILRMTKMASRLSSWAWMVAFALLALSLGLASGVITGISVRSTIRAVGLAGGHRHDGRQAGDG
ncbi:MAG: hypothetical protein U5J98_06895 [Halobacteriales archaeon]|nr:hypothetical protein [Halobacteriales archaeon]